MEDRRECSATNQTSISDQNLIEELAKSLALSLKSVHFVYFSKTVVAEFSAHNAKILTFVVKKSPLKIHGT